MKRFQITVNGTAYDVAVEEIAADAPAPAPSPAKKVSVPSAAAADTIPVKAPMPGTILEIRAAVGSTVKAGDVLVVLEAMKMENEIVAPQGGTVAHIRCAKGGSVNVDDILVELR